MKSANVIVAMLAVGGVFAAASTSFAADAIAATTGATVVAPTAAASSSAPVELSVASIRAHHAQALRLAGEGNIKGAIRSLKQLVKSAKSSDFERDRIMLSIGRLSYEINDFDGAIAAFQKVSKGGDSWLESLEEQAWAEFRRGKPETAIARLKTVTSPAFKDEATSEAFFLLGLAQLRVCDYKSIFKTLEDFKERFRQRVAKLEAAKSVKAKSELKEIGSSVQKLNIVEAEAIQRLYLDENGKRRSGSVPSIAKQTGELSFPTTEGDEFWMDEVEGYKVSLKGCVNSPRRNVKVGMNQ